MLQKLPAEPHKTKIIQKLPITKYDERLANLKDVCYNTFNLRSDQVTFDLTSTGTSAMSQEQLSGILIGDEAYAGSRNFILLENVVKSILGHKRVIPTHNMLGARKLIARVLGASGRVVLTNSTLADNLFADNGMQHVSVKKNVTLDKIDPVEFAGSIDIERLNGAINKYKPEGIAFMLIETCPSSGHSQPFSFKNLKDVCRVAKENKIITILDISFIIENAAFIINSEDGNDKKSIGELVREMVREVDLTLMNAAEDCRSNVGGFVTTDLDDLADKLRNQVVVFEGLHTYGGMAGRTMEVVARGLQEMVDERSVCWKWSQIDYLCNKLKENDVPTIRGGNGVYLPVKDFLPQLGYEDNPLFVLSAALYLMGGMRIAIDAKYEELVNSEKSKTLGCEIPWDSFTNQHLDHFAQTIIDLHRRRNDVQGLRQVSTGDWTDELRFDLKWGNKPFCPAVSGIDEYRFEPWKVKAVEHIGFTDKGHRVKAAKEAGYNTFLLKSEDIGIDALTDSGTSAMSFEQWSKMFMAHETPYASKDYEEFVSTVQEVFGYRYVLPTHQGRAAEHICSQTLIKDGDSVPGNMYFTTTKLHQELAGGQFVDTIIDDAHDPDSTFEWKGNVDLNKMQDLVKRVGADHIPYLSFETCVNMAGGQPASMDNMREVYDFCNKHGILVLFDATRCAENAYLIRKKDPKYQNSSIRDILKEMMSYGDGCTVSSKKDCLVNICGFFAVNDRKVYEKAQNMLRIYEGTITTGGLSCQDLAAHTQGVHEMLDYNYIRARVEQTQYLGYKLIEAGIPIVKPPGSHAIFLNARKFFDHLDQDEYPAQVLSIEIFIEAGIRTMERGNVSKGRDPVTSKNYRPNLELVRITLPRRVYTNSHMDLIVDAIKNVYKRRHATKGLRFVYEPKELRFFQGRFEYMP
jgi:tyrosine phenol-lyase